MSEAWDEHLSNQSSLPNEKEYLVDQLYKEMTNFIRRSWQIFKEATGEFMKNDPMVYSSSIAFYTIFSLPAILIITMSIAGSAYEAETVHENLVRQIQLLFGAESAGMITRVLENNSGVGTTTIAKVVGIGTLIFSATTVFVSLQNGLNHIWGVRAKAQRGILRFVINRIMSLAMVISIGFLLLVSLILDTFIAIFNQMLSDWLSESTFYIVFVVNFLFSLSIVTVVFALIFKVLPDAKIQWRDVWVGALVTTLLFTLGKYLIGFYLGNSSLGSAYGTAGSLVLLLIWVYYSVTIVLFGAQFTLVYSREIGHRIRPSSFAVGVEEVENPTVVVNERKESTAKN